MEQYQEVMKQTNVEMAYELAQMPIGKIRCSKIYSTNKSGTEHTERSDILDDDMDEDEPMHDSFDRISSIFLFFSKRPWEMSFFNQPDMMLKYSVLMGFVVFLSIVVIQILNDQ